MEKASFNTAVLEKKCVTKFMDQGLSLFTEEGILVLLILQTLMFTFLGDQTWN